MKDTSHQKQNFFSSDFFNFWAEKDGTNSCRYCRENRQHPRLARGETYPCGYKPYRCEGKWLKISTTKFRTKYLFINFSIRKVCGYSTTTKGNLTIHLQSDKHANNVRTLRAANKLPKTITIMPDAPMTNRPVSHNLIL